MKKISSVSTSKQIVSSNSCLILVCIQRRKGRGSHFKKVEGVYKVNIGLLSRERYKSIRKCKVNKMREKAVDDVERHKS